MQDKKTKCNRQKIIWLTDNSNKKLNTTIQLKIIKTCIKYILLHSTHLFIPLYSKDRNKIKQNNTYINVISNQNFIIL